ncbi:MAG: vitamin K epoxide reductase family protein [Polyangiaceae bacterium]
MNAESGKLVRSTATFVPVVIGLVASVMLLVDYVRPSPVFCDEGGSCALVRKTAYAQMFGLPTPTLGVAGFLAVAVLAASSGERARTVFAFVSGIGAAFAAFFVWKQASWGVYCLYCLAADVSMLVVSTVAFARLARGSDPPTTTAFRGSAGLVVAFATLVPLVWGVAKPTPPKVVPGPVADAMKSSPPGTLTVVDFVDFECPFCRKTHEALAPLLAPLGDKVHVVRKHVPLAMHPHAREAARAAVCGEVLGKGNAMADALFAADPSELTREGCAAVAARIGLDRPKFDACVTDAATEARIDVDTAAFKASKGRGLPTLWLDDEKLEGMQSRETILPVLGRVRARHGLPPTSE